ncbi:hypothetical protein BaRGS_00040111 [Batillaria attramentaria]|uniref:Uncharacterized protein n=1 Tax=Batillaria attramentaria TaxID=370345 RepID=A0ABD0J1F2_9CAEN
MAADSGRAAAGLFYPPLVITDDLSKPSALCRSAGLLSRGSPVIVTDFSVGWCRRAGSFLDRPRVRGVLHMTYLCRVTYSFCSILTTFLFNLLVIVNCEIAKVFVRSVASKFHTVEASVSAFRKPACIDFGKAPWQHCFFTDGEKPVQTPTTQHSKLRGKPSWNIKSAASQCLSALPPVTLLAVVNCEKIVVQEVEF